MKRHQRFKIDVNSFLSEDQCLAEWSRHYDDEFWLENAAKEFGARKVKELVEADKDFNPKTKMYFRLWQLVAFKKEEFWLWPDAHKSFVIKSEHLVKDGKIIESATQFDRNAWLEPVKTGKPIEARPTPAANVPPDLSPIFLAWPKLPKRMKQNIMAACRKAKDLK